MTGLGAAWVTVKKNGKELKERSVLFKRMEKNAKNGTFFLKERKRTQRMERSFEKNGCPTLSECMPWFFKTPDL